MINLSRRQAIAMLGGLASAPVSAGWAGSFSSDKSGQSLSDTLWAIGVDPQLAISLSRSCQACEINVPDEALKNELETTYKEAGAGNIGQWLMEAARQDFRDGKTKTVDGWVISETEFRFFRVLPKLLAATSD